MDLAATGGGHRDHQRLGRRPLLEPETKPDPEGEADAAEPEDEGNVMDHLRKQLLAMQSGVRKPKLRKTEG